MQIKACVHDLGLFFSEFWHENTHFWRPGGHDRVFVSMVAAPLIRRTDRSIIMWCIRAYQELAQVRSLFMKWILSSRRQTDRCWAMQLLGFQGCHSDGAFFNNPESKTWTKGCHYDNPKVVTGLSLWRCLFFNNYTGLTSRDKYATVYWWQP